MEPDGYVDFCLCLFTFICLVVCCSICFLASLQTPPVASLSLVYDSSEANCRDAEFLIVMGDDPFLDVYHCMRNEATGR